MIIKFEVVGAWQLYDDVDALRYRKLGPHKVDVEDLKDLIDFTETISEINEAGHPGRVLLMFMNSKQLVESNIIAWSPIYIMNGDGRTVEIV